MILHGTAGHTGLLLWGEAPVVSDDGEANPAADARAPRLPFAAPPPSLRAALETIGIVPGKATTATLWLPTVGGQPVASSSIIAPPPASRAKPRLAPWEVDAVAPTPAALVDLLCAGFGRPLLALGVAAGADLSFWTAVLRFAGSLTARQQFLPSVATEGVGYCASWEPVLLGDDADRFARLAGAMPASARAVAGAEEDAPPARAAAAVLKDMLAMLVDHLVRTSVPAEPGRRQRKDLVLHDQWLAALTAPDDGKLRGAATELKQLAAQVSDWRRPLAVWANAPFRLCFRLEEPPEPEEKNGNGALRPSAPSGWYVRYLLQAVDDPSLLIAAAEAWKAKGAPRALQRPGFDPRAYLLAALGQAAGIAPAIEASLRSPTPAGYTLDAAGAHDFLTHKALLLEQAGYSLLLPAWWTRKGTKLRLAARAQVRSAKLQGGNQMSLEEMVDFRWEVALGGETLSRAELLALAKLKAPLVKVRGQYVQLSEEEIRAALEFWKTKAPATAHDAVRLALGAAQPPAGLAFDGLSATGWIRDLLAQLEGRTPFEELPVAPVFQGTLRPYQRRGYSWLAFLARWGLGACLADDMGLGKTIQTLALVQRNWHAGQRHPTLLVCPTSVVGNWRKEAARFTPELPVLIHHGTTRIKGAAFVKEAGRHALVLSSYALLHRDLEVLRQVRWAAVVADEAQNIKNPETKQSKAARSLPAEQKIALTGTPVENNVGDLWAIMEFLNPGFLGTQAEFKRNFFVPIQASQDADAVARLKRLAGPFILRRLKTDKSIIADLPDKLEMKVFCTLTKEQASLYAAVLAEVDESFDETSGIERKGLVLATISKLKQVCNHPAQFLGDNSALPGRSGKLARLTEMLEEALTVGDRALVFSQFAEMGRLLQRHLQETFATEVLFLHGGVARKERDRMVERFQAGGGGPAVFILSLKAGGTGLNLSQANHVFHFDRWWNPAVENQATDRAYRIGQTRNVQVHKFLCAGTLEERIDELIERKRDLAEKVVGTGEAWLTELSTAELRELLALRPTAVGD